ncbi:MAG: GIY-YIG nuclease family protein [Candidatus Paceibacterota bacterium]
MSRITQQNISNGINPVRDRKVMYYTYFIKSLKDGTFYTGSTGDLRKRLNQHNTGRSNYTKSRLPFELLYYEACLDESRAKARELFLKSGMGKRYLRQRLGVSGL